MNTTITRSGCLLILSLFAYHVVFSQIALAFTGVPTLTGTGGATGAKYTYANVGTTGAITIKAVVEITNMYGGAILSDIDGTATGSLEAFQPAIYGSQTDGNFWGILFRISFYNAANDIPVTLTSFRSSGIDVDGLAPLREINTFYYPSSYTLNNPTSLTVTNTSGVYQFLGSSTGYAGISLTTTDVAVTCIYNNRSYIDILIGTACVGGACSAAVGSPRQHSINFFDAVAYGSPMTTLPVKLTSFNANKTSSGVILNWKSSEELSVSHYTVQRSEDGINFSNIAVFIARGSNSSYTYTDDQAAGGTVYYRIKSTDIDGSYTFSRILLVKTETIESGLLSVSPNPVINDIFVTIKSNKNQDIQLRLISQQGKQIRSVMRQVLTGINSFTIENTKGLPKGIYFLQAIFTDGTVNSKKLVVQ